MESSWDVLIYSDGACSGNPGPGGWGAIVVMNGRVNELGDFAKQTTNNRMELGGVIAALKFLLEQGPSGRKLCILTDSTYVIRGITQWIHGWKKRGWKNSTGDEVANQDLWVELERLTKNFQIEWRYVRGHQGHGGNERCDEIAVAFSKGEDIELYSGPANGYLFDIYHLPPQEALPENSSRGSAAPAHCYLSLIGSEVVRHLSWQDCERRVKGVSGAKFKKAKNEQEVEEILMTWGMDKSKVKNS